MNRCIFTLLALLISGLAQGYTRQDTLRGSNGRGRDWWDVMRYSVEVTLDTADRSISGTVEIDFRIAGMARDSMQIDLQDSMQIDKVVFLPAARPFQSAPLQAVREGNAWWITRNAPAERGRLRISYHGKPRIAVQPPWDGGLIWTKDSSGRQWIAVACQGLGASAWWPCKDYQGDEPDSGSSFSLNFRNPEYISGDRWKDTTAVGARPPQRFVRESFPAGNFVSNGRADTALIVDPVSGAESRRISFSCRNPINSYNQTFYYGDYVHWRDTFLGAKGMLNLNFHPLRYNEQKARKQWAVAKDMLRCFEYWLGPYPFYEDGYKLVEAPYLGMEHQSAVAYGNLYKMGYLGTDRSGTGVGLSFDYIVIHESGHEWFGNSITARDIADNWIHEGLTSYTETLFVEWIRGRKAAFQYAEGCWRNIENRRPVIGDYGVNDEGPGDKYDKGAAVIHMVRQLMNDDSAFRQLLRGMNERFYHKIITTQEFEQYIIDRTGLALKPFFQQYLRTVHIPELQYLAGPGGKTLTFRWSNALPGLIAPVRFSTDRGRRWQTVSSTESIPFSGSWKRLQRRLRFERAGLYRLPEDKRVEE